MVERSRWSRPAGILAAGLLISYPLLVWRGLASGSPRMIAPIMLLILAPAAYLRLRSGKQPESRGLAIIPLVTLVSLAFATLLNSRGFILAVPVVINVTFLVSFGSTLRRGSMPMVERFARLQEPDLPPNKQAWCRLWTRLWCGFFIANATTAALLGWLAPVAWWAFYTGILGYVLSGVMFVTEWILRRRRFGSAELGEGAR